MPDKAQEHPRVLTTITNWLGGITAVILALVGLRAAYTQLFPLTQTGNTTAQSNTTAEPTTAPVTKAETLPLRYSKPNGVLEWRQGFWVETDTKSGFEAAFKQVSRKDGTTTAYDESRDLYLRWPNEGGLVQWTKSNPMVWTNLYMAEPEEPAKE
jgi:hypothetical protein